MFSLSKIHPRNRDLGNLRRRWLEGQTAPLAAASAATLGLPEVQIQTVDFEALLRRSRRPEDVLSAGLSLVTMGRRGGVPQTRQLLGLKPASPALEAFHVFALYEMTRQLPDLAETVVKRLEAVSAHDAPARPVVAAARITLGFLKGASRHKMIDSRRPVDRHDAIIALAFSADNENELLEILAQESDPYLLGAAARALAVAASSKAVASLIDLAANDGTRPLSRAFCLGALGLIKNRNRHDPLDLMRASIPPGPQSENMLRLASFL